MKKFLFFDIECSNCFNGDGKICEFGYVVTDEKFNVLKKKHIPMCPGKGHGDRFNNKRMERDPSYSYAYELEYYMQCEEFPRFYERIKNLIMDEDTIVFGYSVDNDINYLNSTIKKYHLENFEYSAYDVQIMYKLYSNSKNIIALDKIFKIFASNYDITHVSPHFSEDDAYMTMIVFKGLCNKLGVTALELLKKYKNVKFNSYDLLEKKELRKISKLNELKSCALKKKYRDKMSQYFVEDEEFSKEKVITISEKIYQSEDKFQKICEFLKEHDYKLTTRINDSGIFLTNDTSDKERILEKLRYPYLGSFMLYEEFISSFENRG